MYILYCLNLNKIFMTHVMLPGARNLPLPDFDTCPYCHFKISPTFQQFHYHSFYSQNKGDLPFVAVWECNNKECGKLVVAGYILVAAQNRIVFTHFLETEPKKPDWKDPIKNLQVDNDATPQIKESSKFSQIYFESLRAEELGLSEIAGMGYRKAVEFLVKDWAIFKNPKDRVKIINQTLAGVIKDYYAGNLKDILDRTAWLGNDETHYVRVFQQYDVSDLKALIQLITTTLSEEDLKQKYIAGMTKYNKPLTL
jgi:hypothetical protein